MVMGISFITFVNYATSVGCSTIFVNYLWDDSSQDDGMYQYMSRSNTYCYYR